MSRLFVTFLGAAHFGHGGWGMAGRVGPRTASREPLFVLPGLGMIAAIPFALMAIYGQGEPWIFGGLFLRRGRDVHEHRAVLHDHGKRRDAKHARRSPAARPWPRFTCWATYGHRP